MPIEYRVDHERRIILSRIHGTLTDDDAFHYQAALGSRPELAGYDELADMTDVVEIVLPSPDRVRDLAWFSATMDRPDQPSRLAIVAPTDLAFGLGRMYEAYRSAHPGSNRSVGVFRTRGEAVAFLGLTEASQPSERPVTAHS